MAEPGSSTFPLVPRERITGLPFGGTHSFRRGSGTDVAALRPYTHGDTVSSIDWRASAKISTARGDDEFVVRERFAEEAPRVVVLADRSPSMALYPAPLPWLAKQRAARLVVEGIARSAAAARAALGYLDFAGAAARHGEPFWLPPTTRSAWDVLQERLDAAGDDAPADGVARGLAFLERSARNLFPGTFVFVVSDFLESPLGIWLGAIARQWEIVPVVIQDPVWEQSFPAAHGVGLPLVEPGGTAAVEVRLTRREAQARQAAHEERRRTLLAHFAELEIDPVLVDTDEPTAIAGAFLEWAALRQTVRVRR